MKVAIGEHHRPEVGQVVGRRGIPDPRLQVLERQPGYDEHEATFPVCRHFAGPF